MLGIVNIKHQPNQYVLNHETPLWFTRSSTSPLGLLFPQTHLAPQKQRKRNYAVAQIAHSYSQDGVNQRHFGERKKNVQGTMELLPYIKLNGHG